MEDIKIYEQVAKNTESINNVKCDVKEVKEDIKVVRRHVTNHLAHDIADLKNDLTAIKTTLHIGIDSRNRHIGWFLKVLPYAVAVLGMAIMYWLSSQPAG